MRFLLGLGFGALTTLSGALLLDWPAAETVLEPVINPEPVTYRAETSETRPPAFAAPTPTHTPAPATATAAPVAPVATEVVTAAPATKGIEAVAAPSPVALPEEPEGPDMAEPGSPALADLDAPTTPQQPVADAESREAPGSLPASSPEAGSKISVWRPFHSQLSAEGFARRLSMQLGYPFEVLKVDAAEYHVVFSYSDDVQRQTLSAQVLELTGYQPRQ